ncbi:hypothetical protein KEM55_004898 [Ascosphaera atra]|nr:hypothetical protein KEM55_004898 [Ascosphaera atra]
MCSTPDDHVESKDKEPDKEPPSTVQVRLRRLKGVTEETIKLDTSWKREIIDYTWSGNIDRTIGVRYSPCTPKDVVETSYLAQASGKLPGESCKECALSSTLKPNLRSKLFPAAPATRKEENNPVEYLAGEFAKCVRKATAMNDINRFREALRVSMSMTDNFIKMKSLASDKDAAVRDEVTKGKS